MDNGKDWESSDNDIKVERDIVAEFDPSEEIVVRDAQELRNKILAMRADGKQKLNVLADFDSTLTRKMYRGKKGEDSYDSIENVT